MDWGKILVDSITVAIIGAAAVIISTLLANWITDIKGYKNISRKIGDVSSTSLSGQHQEIERAIAKGNEQIDKSLEKSTAFLLSKVETTSNCIASQIKRIDERLIEESEAEKYRYLNLDKDQQIIREHVEGVYGLMKEWEKTVSRNIELENKVKVLEEKVQVLTLELSRVNQTRSKYRDEQDLEL